MANAKIGIQADTSSATKALNDVSNAVDGVSTSVNKMSKSGSLKGALRTAKKEAQDLAYQLSQLSAADLKSDFGQKMAEQYRQAVAAAGELKDQMDDVNQEIKNMSSDTRGWDAAKEGIQAVGSAATALVGIYSSVHEESETAAETLKTMATLQSTVNAAITIGNALKPQSALLDGICTIQTKALAAAKTLEASATGKATIAQRVFNAVAKANPYVLLATAVLAVGTALVAFASHSAEAKKKQEELDAEIERSKELMDTYATSVASNSAEMIVKMEALKEAVLKGNLSIKEQTQIYNEFKPIADAAGLSVKNFNDVEDILKNNSEAVRQAINKRALAMAAYAEAIEIAKTAIKQLGEMEYQIGKAAEAATIRTRSRDEMEKELEKRGITGAGAYITPTGRKESRSYVVHDQVVDMEVDVEYKFDYAAYEKAQRAAMKKVEDDMRAKINSTIKVAMRDQNAARSIMGGGTTTTTPSTKPPKASTKTDKEKQTELERLRKEYELQEKALENINSENDKDGKKKEEIYAKMLKINEEMEKFYDVDDRGFVKLKEILQDELKLVKRNGEEWQNVINKIKQANYSRILELSKRGSEGLEEMLDLLAEQQTLVNKDSDEWKQLLDVIQLADERTYHLVDELAARGDTKSLENMEHLFERLVLATDKGSDAWNRYAGILRYVHKLLKDTQNTQEETLEGIKDSRPEKSIGRRRDDLQKRIAKIEEEQSKLEIKTNKEKGLGYFGVSEAEIKFTNLEQEKKKLEDELHDLDATVTLTALSATHDPKWVTEILEGQIGNSEREIDYIVNIRTNGADELGVVDSDIQKVQNRINRIKDVLSRSELYDSTAIDNLKQDLHLCTQELFELTNKKYRLTVESNINELKDEIASTSWGALEGGVDGLQSIYDSIEGLDDKLSNADGIEGFFAAFDAVFTVVDNIRAMVDAIQEVIALIETLNKVQEAAGVVATTVAEAENSKTKSTLDGVAAKQAQTAAETEAATAVGVNAAAEAAATPTLELSAKAKQKAAIAALDLATANIAAAHSEIPFAGPGLAAAGIATVTAAVAAAHSALMSLQAFAEGGIVGGTSTTGDRVLARVNSGEMILNDRQQAHLFNMINNGVTPAGSGELVGTVKVKGSDLHLALSNYDKIQKINRN